VDAEPLLSGATAAVRGLFAAAACSVAVVRDEADLEYVAADGVGATAIVGVRMPVGRGLSGWVAMSGQPIWVRDPAGDPRFARDVAESTAYVPRSMLLAPVHDVVGETVAVLTVLDPEAGPTDDGALEVLGTLAALVGLVLSTPGPGAGQDDRYAELGRRIASLVDELGP
jgi:signal transduction protein with GAF and PtsI domain